MNKEYGTLPSLYTMEEIRDLNVEKDTYLALEIMRLFAKDDPNGFAIVRKQIGKRMKCDYFKK